MAGVISPRLDAAVLLSFTLRRPKEFLYAYPEKFLTAKQAAAFSRLIYQRRRGMPVAYLIEKKEFFGNEFFVNNHVLIPRPKTELLVEAALNLITQLLNYKKLRRPVTLADIGTGSGCIAISLAKKIPSARIFATDISAAALTVAKRNARRHHVSNRIKFYRGNLLAPIKNRRIDILIANPPYLRPNQIKGDIRFEPRRALVAGRDGLLYVKKLLAQLKKFKLFPQHILFEVDHSQIKTVKRIAKAFLSPKISIHPY